MLNDDAQFGAKYWQPSLSPADAAIIVITALIIFGPKKWSCFRADVGQAKRELRKITRNK